MSDDNKEKKQEQENIDKSEWCPNCNMRIALCKCDKIKEKSNYNEVSLRDLNIPMSWMVLFMVKWAIASIPAFIILFLIGMMVMGIFGVGIATLFR